MAADHGRAGFEGAERIAQARRALRSGLVGIL
jgi:hypothetical protein